MNHLYYSFDIFDTCIIRTCGYPHNVFDLLAIAVLGNKSSNSLRADFVNIRISAEASARKKKQSEVTLEDIYQECDFNGISSIAKNIILDTEIEIERKVLTGVASVRMQVEKIHKKNLSVFFISDMYLPETFIKEILVREHFWKEGDKLYVSCVSGKTKQSGELFDLVAKENDIPTGKWHHWGDNKHSDYIIPRKKKIKAHLIKHEYSFYEKRLLNMCLSTNEFINQRIAGLQRAVRLSLGSTPEIDLASNIVVPSLTAFTYNVLSDAREHNITSLFFLARDGYILYHIAKLFEQNFPEIKLHYLYTSRSALYFPGLSSLDKEYLLKLFGDLTGEIIYECFIHKANIDIKPFIKEQEYYTPVPNNNIGKELIESLYNKRVFIEQLIREYNRQKELTLKYFIQEGMAQLHSSCAIVDVRGSRSCHAAINGILKEAGYAAVKGYYWEVLAERKSVAQAGEYYAELFEEKYSHGNPYFKSLKGTGTLIEQYFCANGSARTMQYQLTDNVIKPIYEPNSALSSKEKICDVHTLVADYYIDFLRRNNLIPYFNEITISAYQNFCFFARLPRKRDLIPIQNVKINETQFHYIRLIQKHSFFAILKRNFKKFEWGRGSLAYNMYLWFGERIGHALLVFILNLRKN